MYSFIVIPLLLGFIEMATMHWGLEAFFASQKLQARPRLARWLKIMVTLLGCGGLVAVMVGLTHQQGGQPTVGPLAYIFMVAHVPVALGSLAWGMDACGFKKDFTVTMKLLRYGTVLAIPVGLLMCFFAGPIERMFLVLLVTSLILMIPGAVSWGMEVFGYTLLKPRFFIVRAVRFVTSAVVLFSFTWGGVMGLLLVPGLIVGWLTR